MPPSDPAAVCLCGSPHVDWTANGKLMCAMCAANFVAASGSFVTPAAVPPPEEPRIGDPEAAEEEGS